MGRQSRSLTLISVRELAERIHQLSRRLSLSSVSRQLPFDPIPTQPIPRSKINHEKGANTGAKPRLKSKTVVDAPGY